VVILLVALVAIGILKVRSCRVYLALLLASANFCCRVSRKLKSLSSIVTAGVGGSSGKGRGLHQKGRANSRQYLAWPHQIDHGLLCPLLFEHL